MALKVNLNPRQELVLWVVGMCAVLWIVFSRHNLLWAFLVSGALFVFSLRTRASPTPKWFKFVVFLLVFVSVALSGASYRRALKERFPFLKTEKAMPTKELSRLEGTARITDYGYVEVEIYNGTKWAVKKIIIHITVTGPPSNEKGIRFIPDVVDRNYVLTPKGGCSFGLEANSACEFFANLGFKLAKDQNWSWNIAEASGEPPGKE